MVLVRKILSRSACRIITVVQHHQSMLRRPRGDASILCQAYPTMIRCMSFGSRHTDEQENEDMSDAKMEEWMKERDMRVPPPPFDTGKDVSEEEDNEDWEEDTLEETRDYEDGQKKGKDLSGMDPWEVFRYRYYSARTFQNAWEHVYGFEDTRPWEIGPVKATDGAILQHALAKDPIEYNNVLITGCGVAPNDVRVAIERFNKNENESNVIAMDISTGAIMLLSEHVKYMYNTKNKETGIGGPTGITTPLALVSGDFFQDEEWESYFNYPGDAVDVEDNEFEKDEEDWARKENWQGNFKDNIEVKPPNDDKENTEVVAKQEEEQEDAKVDATSWLGNAKGKATSDGKEAEEISTQEDSEDIALNGEHSSGNRDNEDSSNREGTETKVEAVEPRAVEDVKLPILNEDGALGRDFATELLEKAGSNANDATPGDDGKNSQPAPLRGFDLIYDRNFFTYIPMRRRMEWGNRLSELMNPDVGRLITVMDTQTPESQHGPPFPATLKDYKQVLDPFDIVLDSQVYKYDDRFQYCFWKKKRLVYGPENDPDLEDPEWK